MTATAELQEVGVDAGFDPMARKKAEPEVPKTLFAVKGVESWFEWLKEFADSTGTTAMSAIDQALIERAQKLGFRPMPRRMGPRSD